MTDRLSYLTLLGGLGTCFVVLFEPAPTDILFAMSILFVLASASLRLPRNLNTFAALWAGFLVANFISAFWWKDAVFGARYLAITFYLMLLPMLMLHHASGSNGNVKIDRMYQAFFIACFLSGLIGLLAILRLMPGPLDLYYRSDDGLRLSPLFKDPNVFAPFMGTACVLLLGKAVARDQKRVNLLLGLAIYAFMMMFLSFSRAAWLNTGLSIVLFAVGSLLFVRDRRALARVLWISSAGAIAATLIAVFVLIELNLLDFLFHRSHLQSYDTERFGAWRLGVEAFQTRPLGIGPGHFVGRAYFPNSDFAIASHNTYIKIAVENGLLGLLCFCAAIAVVLVQLTKSFRIIDGREPLRIAIAAVIVGQLTNSFFVDSLHWRHLFIAIGFGCLEIYRCRKGLIQRARQDLEPGRLRPASALR